jgi:hypothetical protein
VSTISRKRSRRRTPTLSPTYDLVATLPYIEGDELALTFGGSRYLEEITDDQVRRFTDNAGLPVTPVVRAVRETTEATAAAWGSSGTCFRVSCGRRSGRRSSGRRGGCRRGDRELSDSGQYDLEIAQRAARRVS